MGRSIGIGVLLLFVTTAALGAENFLQRIKQQFDTGSTPSLEDFKMAHFAWAGKCVRSREPNKLYGGVIHGYTESDPVIGTSTFIRPLSLTPKEEHYLGQRYNEAKADHEIVLKEFSKFESVYVSQSQSLFFREHRNANLGDSVANYHLRKKLNGNGNPYFVLKAEPYRSGGYYCYFTKNTLIDPETRRRQNAEDDREELQ